MHVNLVRKSLHANTQVMLHDNSNNLKWKKLILCIYLITLIIICSDFNISTYVAACMTTEGKQCLFPFKYMNKTDDSPDASLQEITYTKCSTETLYRPWCPTSMIVNLNRDEISLIYFKQKDFKNYTVKNISFYRAH